MRLVANEQKYWSPFKGLQNISCTINYSFICCSPIFLFQHKNLYKIFAGIKVPNNFAYLLNNIDINFNQITTDK